MPHFPLFLKRGGGGVIVLCSLLPGSVRRAAYAARSAVESF